MAVYTVLLEVSVFSTTESNSVTSTTVVVDVSAGQVLDVTETTVLVDVAVLSVTESVEPGLVDVAVLSVTESHRVHAALAEIDVEALGESFHSATANERYELFGALVGDPIDFSDPLETFTSLPHDTLERFRGANSHRVVVRRRNKWGITSLNLRERELHISRTHFLLGYLRPSPPRELALEQAAGAEVRITAVYDERWEVTGTAAAGSALLYTTTDGTDPDPDTDTPIVLIAAIPQPPQPRVFDFNHPSGPFGDGVEVRMLMRMRGGDANLDVDSISTPIASVTIATSGPPAPAHLGTGVYQEAG